METSCRVCGGAHITGACTESPKPASTGQQIETALKDIGEGIKEAAFAKAAEYDERIRAAKEGKPLKAGDTATNLISDFRRFTGQEWAENFDMVQYRTEKLVDGDKQKTTVKAETTGSVKTIEQVDPERINTFILKLAEAPNLSSDEAVSAMVEQIKLLENDKKFPDLLGALDPEQYHPQTKTLDETSKQRLEAALDKYVKERG